MIPDRFDDFSDKQKRPVLGLFCLNMAWKPIFLYVFWKKNSKIGTIWPFGIGILTDSPTGPLFAAPNIIIYPLSGKKENRRTDAFVQYSGLLASLYYNKGVCPSWGCLLCSHFPEVVMKCDGRHLLIFTVFVALHADQCFVLPTVLQVLRRTQ